MQSYQPVWDIWIRLGHWLLVAGIIFQYVSGENIELIDAHATVGILLCGWVIFRIAWGLSGPLYARFKSFPLPEPTEAISAIGRLISREIEPTPGHTTIGGVGVYLLIALIGLTALTGMASSDDIFFEGPLAAFLPSTIVEYAGDIHPVLSDLVFITALLHVSAILWHTYAMKEPLIKGMVTGLKPSFGKPIGHPHPFSKMIVLRGFVFFTLCIGGAYGFFAIYLGW